MTFLKVSFVFTESYIEISSFTRKHRLSLSKYLVIPFCTTIPFNHELEVGDAWPEFGPGSDSSHFPVPTICQDASHIHHTSTIPPEMRLWIVDLFFSPSLCADVLVNYWDSLGQFRTCLICLLQVLLSKTIIFPGLNTMVVSKTWKINVPIQLLLAVPLLSIISCSKLNWFMTVCYFEWLWKRLYANQIKHNRSHH